MRTEGTFNAGVSMPVAPAKKPHIKKIPPELRRRRIVFSHEPVWHRRFLWRLKEDSQFLRTTVQAAFALLCVWIGIEFTLFARWVFGILVAGVFVAITGLAVVTGHWQNGISQAEYQHRFEQLDSPVFQHFRGHVPQYGPND